MPSRPRGLSKRHLVIRVGVPLALIGLMTFEFATGESVRGVVTGAITLVAVAWISHVIHQGSPPDRIINGVPERRGWYLDPDGTGKWLWWDGSSWAERPVVDR
jgi:hypothetical protein